MPSGCSQYVRDICRRIDKENELCPKGHDFGEWGEWHRRKWRRSYNTYWVRFRVCKRCKHKESQISEKEPWVLTDPE